MKKILHTAFLSVLLFFCALAANDNMGGHDCESCETAHDAVVLNSDTVKNHEIETKDEHEGHDHAAETKDEHEGHDHEAETKDEHEGHDHEAETKDEHEGHDHAAETKDEHEGHDHEAETGDEHEGHDHSGHTDMVEGINLDKNKNSFELIQADAGEIKVSGRLQGIVEYYQPETLKITPRISGVISKIFRMNGETVKKGEPIAEIESTELGIVLAGYMQTKLESVCCALDYSRAVSAYNTISELSAFLAGNPDVSEIKKQNLSSGGEAASKLIAAYCDYKYAEQVFERERKLYERKIGKEEDYFSARKDAVKAGAEYATCADRILFEAMQNRNEEEIKLKTARVSLDAAIANLNMLGFSREDIESLESEYSKIDAHECKDPDCSDCRAAAYSKNLVRDMVSKYLVKSPADGVICEMNLFPGQTVSEGIMNIMTGNRVMVNLKLYGKDMHNIRKSTPVQIFDLSGEIAESGRIFSVNPFIDNASGAADAYAVIENRHKKWMPGMQVYASYALSSSKAAIVIPGRCIQTFEGKPVVFVKSGPQAQLRFVQPGMKDSEHIEIVAGLNKGEQVIGKGSFELKAALITGSMDAHAGHGH